MGDTRTGTRPDFMSLLTLFICVVCHLAVRTTIQYFDLTVPLHCPTNSPYPCWRVYRYLFWESTSTLDSTQDVVLFLGRDTFGPSTYESGLPLFTSPNSIFHTRSIGGPRCEDILEKMFGCTLLPTLFRPFIGNQWAFTDVDINRQEWLSTRNSRHICPTPDPLKEL